MKIIYHNLQIYLIHDKYNHSYHPPSLGYQSNTNENVNDNDNDNDNDNEYDNNDYENETEKLSKHIFQK